VALLLQLLLGLWQEFGNSSPGSLYRPELDSPVIDRVAELAAQRNVPPHRLPWRGSRTSSE